MKKNNGFAIWTVAASVLIFFGAISFSACQNELLDSPSFQNRGSYSTGRVAAPTNLTATQGGFRSITIKWTAAKSAVFYNIYHSDTATGNFTFLEQTPDATCSYTTSADPDVKKYYKIQSVDTNGEVSEQYSQICFGTTLATPIITSIKQNAKGDAITVRWYKGVNCTTDTYLNDSLNYTIVLYNADGTQVLREETISAMDVKEAADTKYTFTNLTPNTKYKIQIKAYTKSAQDSKSTESSDKEDQSTAHSLIPAAPENFSVSKGTSKDSVTLSWELPKYAEIKSATAFETRPVYFKIYRKLESAPENAYEPIITYLGTKAPTINEKDEKGNPKLEKTAIQFTKPAEEASATNDNIKVGESLAVSKTDSEGNEIKIIEVTYPSEVKETDPNYPDYIPGTKITLNDLTVSRGQKYSYRVQSFIDDNGKKNVTSDESYSEETGWLINSPTVSVSSTYQENKDDENKIDSFTVTLNFKFDDFDQPYNYVITETCQKMKKATVEGEQDQPEGDPIIRKPNSTSYTNFFPWKYTYTPPKEENTYLLYTYEVAVCQKDSKNDDSNKYIKVSAPGSVIVINDKSMIPDVSSFKVEDGYKDKFKLSWDYDPNCKYILSWKNTDKNGNETSNEYEFQETDFVDDDGKPIKTKTNFEYDHKAESGDIRTQYTLNADNGLKNHKTAKDENENMEFKTLGTPEPYFEPSYTSIKVIWQAVQKADSTKYVAKYKSENNEEITIPTQSIKTDDEGKTFYCEITKPYGETTTEKAAIDNATDATIAGKDIEFILTAGSNVDTCDTKIPVSTLGPANLDLKITGDRKTITLTWNKVKGAKGYLVFRKKYIKDYFDSEDDKGDLYYCSDENNQENLSVTLIGADAEPSASCVSNTPGTLKFTDKYQPVTESYYQDQYRTAQAQLAWGLPYGYTVIPVKDSSDFEFDEAYEIKGTSNSIVYTEDSLKKVEKKGATFGYGLAIEASKATTDKNVKVSWKTPYNTTKIPILLYRRYNEKNGSKWIQYEYYDGKNTDLYTECPPEEPCKAYDYLVYYNFDETIDIDPYYEYFLSQRTDSDDEKENKGYILSFEKPQARYAGSDTKSDPNYYAEKFTWRTANFTIYDTNERKKKPDSIKIFMLNTNKAIGWQEIAEINPTTLKATAITENCIKYDLDVDTTDAYSITVAPDGIKNKGATNTNGLLKVLRDAKHYYKIKGERKDGDTSIYATVGDDTTVGDNTTVGDKDLIYAYRQITDEELVKATMLVIADAFNITPEGNTTNGAEGSFWWNGEYIRWSVPIRYALKMKINNYLYSWKNLPNQQLSVTPINNFIKITDLNESNEARGKASDGKPLFMCLKEDDNFSISKLIPLTIENTHIPLSSYSGTVNFATSDTQFSVTVEHNGSQTFKKDVSGKEEVQKWFPAKIGNNAYIGDTAEYWWE